MDPLSLRRLGGTIVVIAGLALAACSPSAPATPTTARPTQPTTATTQTSSSGGGNVEAGKALFQAKGCIGCHVTKAVAGAVGTTGPDLDGLASRAKIAGTLDMNAENLRKWLKDPPAVKPGTLMPNLGLSDQEIDNLVAFLMTLK